MLMLHAASEIHVGGEMHHHQTSIDNVDVDDEICFRYQRTSLYSNSIKISNGNVVDMANVVIISALDGTSYTATELIYNRRNIPKYNLSVCLLFTHSLDW